MKKEQELLMQNISETSEIKQILQKMKFDPININLFKNCTTLEELRLANENYFIKNLEEFNSKNELLFTEKIEEIRNNFGECMNSLEIIDMAQAYFKQVFIEKLKFIDSLKYRIFYPDINEEYNFDEKVFL